MDGPKAADIVAAALLAYKMGDVDKAIDAYHNDVELSFLRA